MKPRAPLILALLLAICLSPLAVEPLLGEAPPRALFTSDFDLGAIDSEELAEIADPQFIKDWVQQYPESGYPRFMQVKLKRPPSGEGRYLSLPMRGARARLITKTPIQLAEGQLLRFEAMARWNALGNGGWGLRLVVEGQKPVVIFEAKGEKPEWGKITSEQLAPAGIKEGTLELWLESPPGSRDGELSLDDITLVAVPRVTWSFHGELRRVSEGDEFPFTVASRGYPADTYALEFTVCDSAKRECFRDTKTLLVSEQYPIHFSPRFDWATHSLPRGIYDMTLHLRASAGWEDVQHRRFALAGPPPFERRAGGILWGFELAACDQQPEWLATLAPDRLLIEYPPPVVAQVVAESGVAAPVVAAQGVAQVVAALDAQPLALPEWLVRYGKVQIGGILDPSTWGPEQIAKLDAFSTQLPDWFLRDSQQLGQAIECFEQVRKTAPYLRYGTIAPSFSFAAAPGAGVTREVMITLPPLEDLLDGSVRAAVRPERWVARLELLSARAADQAQLNAGEAAALLGKTLFAAATLKPSSIVLVSPDQMLLERPDTGDAVASEAMLVWEFVTAFLSGADFVAEEPLDPEVRTLLFRRDGEDFLLILGGTGERELAVHSGGQVTAYDQTGTSTTFERDAEGLVHLPVGKESGRDLSLVRGLDFPRIRTVNSVRAVGEGIGNRGDEQRVTVEVTNYYQAPARITLHLAAPAAWEGEWKIEPKRVDQERSERWECTYRVPPWFGIEGSNTLVGEIKIEPATGPEVVMPITIAVPMNSPYVEIKPLGIGAADADVSIKNLTSDPVTLTVYMMARPGGAEKTWVEQTLAPGAERAYRLSYDVVGAGGGDGDRSGDSAGTPGQAAAAQPPAQLWVGVTLNRQQSYINKVYRIPRP